MPYAKKSVTGAARDYAARQGVDATLLFTFLRKLDFPREQFDTDMRGFSAGQKKKILLACGMCKQAHLYVWDEPLNYIDLYSRIQIEELILCYKPTLLFVEHDRAFCANVATRELRLPNTY